MRNHFLPALSITFLLLSSFASGCFGSEEEGSEMDNWEWVDPVEEMRTRTTPTATSWHTGSRPPML